jgi:hypothetical protein
LPATTDLSQAAQPWSARLGYGRPDAAAAARRMLGTIRGAALRNRAIPLFDFYREVPPITQFRPRRRSQPR